uniref:sensor histidine kinase n=1 Tax=Spirosoma spitsbergense TaxID=431554 RepID=UPI00037198E6
LYKTIGENQQVRAHTEQGITYMHKAIAINEHLNVPLLLSENYVNLGILYEDLGQFQRGRDCFLKALAINDEVHAQPEAYRVIYNNLGKNHIAQHEYQQAIPYLNKALAINLPLNRTTSIAHNYRNLASAYRGLGQVEQAVQYGEKAVAAVNASKDAPLTRSVYRTMAELYAAAGQYDKAYGYVVQQKKLEDSLMNLEKTRVVTQLQGRFDVQMAQELATIKANLALAKAREVATIEAEKATVIATLQAEESRKLAQIRASAEVEKARAVAELQTRYETQKRTRQLAVLDQQNQKKTRQVQYMAGGLGLLILLLGALITQYQTIRRTNARLSVQNELITTNSRQLTEQSDQLKTLMKELHHRVKNNLAIVSSLLSLQSDRLTDPDAIRAVEQGQHRVDAMSLIHQRLYRTDNVLRVNLGEYVTDLAESLMQAYGYSHDTFDLRIMVDQHEVNVDMAIPLGLILNELLTNAFKHAYRDVDRPALSIRLQHNDGLTLEVEDNGPGFDTERWQHPEQLESFGWQLINSLSQQVGGLMTVGSRCLARLPEPVSHAPVSRVESDTGLRGAYFHLHITEPMLVSA